MSLYDDGVIEMGGSDNARDLADTIRPEMMGARRRPRKKDASKAQAKGESGCVSDAVGTCPAYIACTKRNSVEEEHRKGLQELWLCNHTITKVSHEIQLIRNLKVVALTNNSIESFPRELCGLQFLERLLLGRNKITTLPVEITALQRIRELRLNDNQIQLFPIDLTLIPSIRRLSLANNAITILPPEIRRFVNMHELDLDGNSIGPSLPEPVQKSLISLDRTLRIFGLAHNYFTREPECISKMVKLHVFRFLGNRAKDYVVKDELTVRQLISS